MPRYGRLMANILGFIAMALFLVGLTVCNRVERGPVPIPEFSELQVIEGPVSGVAIGEYEIGRSGYLLTLRGQRPAVWYEHPLDKERRVPQELVRGTFIRAWIGPDPSPIREWLSFGSPMALGQWAFQLEANGQLLRSYEESAQRRERLNREIPDPILTIWWIAFLVHVLRTPIARLVRWLNTPWVHW